MNLPPSFDSCSSIWLSKICCFFLVLDLFVFSSSSSSPFSYSDHCSSTVPRSNLTHPIQKHPSFLPDLSTVYFNGGEGILGKTTDSQSANKYSGRETLRVRFRRAYDETLARGVYRVKALLIFERPPFYEFDGRNSSYGSYYHRNVTRRYSRPLTFSLEGFWSKSSRRLCMIGSASRRTEKGQLIDVDAVLKLQHGAGEKPGMFSSITIGTLESLSSADEVGYFETVSIFSFPAIVDYGFALVSEELGKWSESGSPVGKNESLSIASGMFCRMLAWRILTFDFEHKSDCKIDQKCVVSLFPVQCSEEERNLRYLIRFQNASYFYSDEAFDVNSTMIGEGSWNDSSNRLYTVLCGILDPTNHFTDSVGDCSSRLSLRYPSVWTIRNHADLVGEIWTNRSVDETNYFPPMILRSSSGYEYGSEPVVGLKYEYTELDRVKRQCEVKKVAKKGVVYPRGDSYNMRFDMYVENSKGKRVASGYTSPLWVGDELYQGNQWLAMAPAPSQDVDNEPETMSSPLNISFTIVVRPYYEGNQSLIRDGMDISAEGFYYPETGHLCMVGCKVLKNVDKSVDCEILVKFDFPPLDDITGGGVIKGRISSTRARNDPLYFDDLSVESAAFYIGVAEESIWRMDVEMVMVLASNVLMCLFAGLQILHIKRNPEVVSSISLVMVVVLCLGYMVPLVLNFEALYKQPGIDGRGWLEANEVTVRVVTMITFLLHLRLVQLVWSSKVGGGDEKGSRAGEKKAGFVSLGMYVLGGLVTLATWKWNRGGLILGYFVSYAGLVLDVFLVPQVLLNCFSGGSVKALSGSFYMGTSTVRLVPHAYDQYRAHSLGKSYVNGTYYYANPAAEFYSTGWDVVIPLVVVALAVIVFVQQRLGGRCILPRRFRELELYGKVPATESM